jgi:two-component system response regulator NreC
METPREQFEPPPAAPAATDGRIRVFLADDHAMVREGLAALVAEEADFVVVGQCGDGLQVVQEVERTGPQLVVLDITMPGLNGLDVCRQLVRGFPHIRVVILTIHDDEQFVVRALEHGAAGYLLKEAAAEQLIRALRTVAAGGTFLASPLSSEAMDRIASEQGDVYESLTSRERQVLQLIAEGKTNRQIAQELNVALKTIDTHRSRLMQKLDLHDQAALIKYALRRGIVSLD